MKEKFEKINCNLCGEDNAKSISEKGQFDLPANVVICRNCGLTYLNPRWTKDTYLDFYTNHYDKYYRPNIKNISVKESDVNPIFERLSKAKLLINQPLNILDVGSGSGLNLDYFKLKYPSSNFYAIEPSDTAVDMLERKGVEVISRDVDNEWHIPVQKKFDLIIMRHVLEHFSDPVGALQKVESTLSDNGILYIAVPNCFNPITPLLTNWFRVVHTYYFNKVTLNGILSKSGLNMISAAEGDDFNRGELYVVAKKGKDNSAKIIDSNIFKKQLAIYEKMLEKERKLFPTLRRKFKFLNQKIRR